MHIFILFMLDKITISGSATAKWKNIQAGLPEKRWNHKFHSRFSLRIDKAENPYKAKDFVAKAAIMRYANKKEVQP